MSRSEIMDELKEILAMADDRNPGDIEYSEDANLISDVGLSSVGILYMVIAMEETFKISFDDVSFGDFKTLKNVIDFIEERVGD